MSQEQITFRPWRDLDEEQILALVRVNYGDIDPAHSEFFNWEYRQNPAGRAIICCGLLAGETIVSVLAAVPVPILFKGRAATAAVLVNGLTHPDYRDKGFFPVCGNAVGEMLEQNKIAFSYGFPNPNSHPGLIRKVGYSDIGRATLLIRLFEPAALLATKFPRLGQMRMGGLARMFIGAIAGNPRKMTSVKVISSLTGFPMESVREKAGIVVDCANIDWLNWRYAQVPRRDYRIAIAGDKSSLLGVAVYRVSEWEGVRIGTVNELFLPDPCEQAVVESLMHHIFQECEERECAATFSLVSPSSRKLRMLKRAGFLIVPSLFEPQPFPVILKGHTVAIEGVTVADMEVSFGTYDVF